MTTKTVLVQLNQYSRKITLDINILNQDDEMELLQKRVRAEFKELLEDEDKLIFQAKDDDFGGLFVDFFDKNVPDNGIFKIVIQKPIKEQAKVFNSYLFNINYL